MALAHQQTDNAEVDVGTSITLSNFAVGSGTDRSLVVCVGFSDIGENDTVVSSVVFNTTETFTQQAAAYNHPGGSHTIGAEVWTLDNPSNTTADVVVTFNNTVSNGAGMTCSEWTGANNGVGANVGESTGNGTNPSTTFNTGDANSVIVAAVGQYDTADSDYTPGTNTTERVEDHIFQNSYLCLEEDASGGSDTIDCTKSGASTDWAVAAIELVEASVAGETLSIAIVPTDSNYQVMKPIIVG